MKAYNKALDDDEEEESSIAKEINRSALANFSIAKHKTRNKDYTLTYHKEPTFTVVAD